MSSLIRFLASTMSLFAAVAAYAGGDASPPFSAYAGTDFPLNVYWGDTHLHSNLSLDAGTTGPARGGIEMTPQPSSA